MSELVLCIIIYTTRHWTYIHIWAGVGILIPLPLYFFVPESPRWLIRKKKYKEAQDIITKAAKFNGVSLLMFLYNLKCQRYISIKFYGRTKSFIIDLKGTPLHYAAQPSKYELTWHKGLHSISTKFPVLNYTERKLFSILVSFLFSFQKKCWLFWKDTFTYIKKLVHALLINLLSMTKKVGIKIV